MDVQPVQVAAIAGSLAVLAVVAQLIRKGHLKPRYALLWMACAGALLLVSVWRGVIDEVGALFGVDYKPSLLFLATDGFLILVLLHVCVALSDLTDKVRVLAQEVAILRDAGGETDAGDSIERPASTSGAGGAAG